MTVTTELEWGDVQVFRPNDPADADAAFERVWEMNPDAAIEQTAEGDILIMPPAGGESGNQSEEACWQLGAWARRDGTGKVFDSSTTFRLPNGAKRSPDAAWVSKERIRALPRETRKEFLPFAPEFAVEVRSPSDRRKQQREKCLEYVANGTLEAWLIDPKKRSVDLFLTDGSVIELSNAESVTSRHWPSFTMDLRPIWEGLDI